jgi:hypothetical protein
VRAAELAAVGVPVQVHQEEPPHRLRLRLRPLSNPPAHARSIGTLQSRSPPSLPRPCVEPEISGRGEGLAPLLGGSLLLRFGQRGKQVAREMGDGKIGNGREGMRRWRSESEAWVGASHMPATASGHVSTPAALRLYYHIAPTTGSQVVCFAPSHGFEFHVV